MTEPAPLKNKKILIVEDHPLFRSMLVQLVEKELGMMVCGEVDNIRDALVVIEKTRPDAAIVDITLNGSSGLELLKNIAARNLQLPVLVLSMHEESLYAERVLRAGARGYISKQEAPSVVVEAIRKMMAGGIYVSERMNATILERLKYVEKTVQPTGIDVLSDREIEVFELIGRGIDPAAVAQRLNLGINTVATYRTRIREKLGLKNAAELYQRAAIWVATRNE